MNKTVSKNWSNYELECLYAFREEGIPYRVIAIEIKRSSDACEKKYRATVWSKMPFYDAQKHRMKEDLKRGYFAKITELSEKRFEAEKYKTDIIADKIVMAIESLPKVNRSIYKFNSKNDKKHSNEDVGLILCDGHIGHCHTLEETGGISEYNLDIFKQRTEALKKNTASIVELHSKLYSLPTLHIFCLGDMVAGMNNTGSWSPVYINMPIYDQMMAGFDAISDMIYYWLGIFDNIVFYGVAGNHSRASQQGTEKEYVNWDFLCYKFVEARFVNNPNVKFIVPKTWWILSEIRNHKFLMVHGDDIKGFNNINSLCVYEQKMAGIIKSNFDYMLMGHFHSSADITTSSGRIISGGSFLGPDVYSLKNLQKGSKPEQKIFGIHDKRGVTWSYNLDLDLNK